jgi:hypothetical protein
MGVYQSSAGAFCITISIQRWRMSELRVGFITWEPNYGDPKFTAAAQAPPPGSYTIHTIGGKRSLARIQEEIATLEKHLGYLKSEMSGHPDYRKSQANPLPESAKQWTLPKSTKGD